MLSMTAAGESCVHRPSPRLAGAAAFVVWLGLGPLPVQAEIYWYKDADGQSVLTDQLMPGYELVKKIDLADRPPMTTIFPRSAGAKLPAATGSRSANRALYAPLIERIAREHQLRPELMHAVIRAESGYDPVAVSRAGAVGLMQLMPATAERFGVRDRTDPVQNLRGGAAYLRELVDMFNRNLQLALAGYNAGENAVIQHGNRVPPYAETEEYVRRVLQYYVDERSDKTATAAVVARN
jgi:soluble lytic murein transglycosylase-like protein